MSTLAKPSVYGNGHSDTEKKGTSIRTFSQHLKSINALFGIYFICLHVVLIHMFVLSFFSEVFWLFTFFTILKNEGALNKIDKITV